MARPVVATYSIAACDLEARQWGVATQSKFLAVGSVVPWAEAEVGAVATQAYANPLYGRDGLDLPRGDVHGRRVHGLGRRPHGRRLGGAGEHPRLGGDRRRARRRLRGVRGAAA